MKTATAVLDNATEIIGDAFNMHNNQKKLLRYGLIGGAVYVGYRVLRNLTK